MRITALLTLIGLTGCGESNIDSLSAEDVQQIEVRMLPWGGPGPEPEPVRSDDREVIRLVLEALKSIEPAPMHKCSAVGELVLAKRSGKVIKLYFLPGHDQRFYEYGGQGKTYRVDREKFVEAMQKLKVKVPRDCGKWE